MKNMDYRNLQMTEEVLINAYLAHQHEQAKKYLIVDDLCDALNKEDVRTHLQQARKGKTASSDAEAE